MIAAIVYVAVVCVLGSIFVELARSDGGSRKAPLAVLAATIAASALVAIAMLAAGSG